MMRGAVPLIRHRLFASLQIMKTLLLVLSLALTGCSGLEFDQKFSMELRRSRDRDQEDERLAVPTNQNQIFFGPTPSKYLK